MADSKTKVKVWEEKIHSMDNGTPRILVETEGHRLEIYWWWENCGLVGETIECSCDFHSTQYSGNGCWQWGHNEPENHVLDGEHAQLILDGLKIAYDQGNKYLEFKNLYWVARLFEERAIIKGFLKKKVSYGELKQKIK